MSTPSPQKQSNSDVSNQPLTPEEVSPEQRQAHHDTLMNENPTVNPGDRVQEKKSLEEKSQQVAVNTADITGERVVVPTYFVVEEEDGNQEALHHVKDAEEISDVIRQARTDEDGDRKWR